MNLYTSPGKGRLVIAVFSPIVRHGVDGRPRVVGWVGPGVYLQPTRKETGRQYLETHRRTPFSLMNTVYRMEHRFLLPDQPGG